MITYQSSLRNSPPGSVDFPAVEFIKSKSPYRGYNENHQDVLRMLARGPSMEAYKANSDYALRQQEAQRDLALAGLQQQSQARNNARDLGVQRLQSMTGLFSNLLSGLFA